MSTPQPTPADGDPPRNSADLAGKRLGDYQILHRLGRGGMADVYLAEQGSLRRNVALKILRSHLAEDHGYVQRFHREARAAAALVHANIVQIYEVGEADGLHYIAQEYVPGRNLRQLLQQHGPPELSLAVSILRQVAAALHKAASQQIVHRDIKPENILLTGDGEVKVADFGLAHIANDAEALHLTGAGVTMGTPLYMSPEQVESGEVDCRSDIYSLGVTCYHMLTGRPPFEGETAIAVAMKHAKDQPQALKESRAEIPAPLAELVHAMLEKRAGDRPQTPAEVLRRLRAMQLDDAENWTGPQDQWSGPELMALAGQDSATQQLSKVMQAESEARQQQRSLWIWWAVAIVAALFVGTLAARLNAPGDLLAFQRNDLPPVKRQQSAAEQYYYASLAPVNAERAYRSVADYFPPKQSAVNARYARLASMRLFELYFEQGNLVEAQREAMRLAAADPTEREARAYGIAGEVLILAQQEKTEQLAQRLADLIPLAAEVPPPLREKLSEAGIDLQTDRP